MKISSALFITLVVSSTASFANEPAKSQTASLALRPYVGIEYNYIDADIKNYTADINSNNINDFSGEIFANRYHGLVPNAGVRIGEYAGLEIGYLRSTEESQNLTGTDFLAGSTGKTETKISGWHVDANGYLPLSEKLEALGSVGVGHYKAESKVSGTIVAGGFNFGSGSASDEDSDTALRLGTGLQYSLTDNVNLRGMVRYIDVEFKDGADKTADGVWTGAIGVNYEF